MPQHLAIRSIELSMYRWFPAVTAVFLRCPHYRAALCVKLCDNSDLYQRSVSMKTANMSLVSVTCDY